jgi:hypothetical protein
MTRSDQARLLRRKASQDLAVLDKLLDDPTMALWSDHGSLVRMV